MSYWNDLKKNETFIREEYTALWAAAGEGVISQGVAQHTLKVLWDRTHLDLRNMFPNAARIFPTKQRYPEILTKVDELYWVDHATAGVSAKGTLGWFSSELRKRERKFKSTNEAVAYITKHKGAAVKGDVVTWKGLAGASTHFVAAHDGTPFYIVNINDGA